MGFVPLHDTSSKWFKLEPKPLYEGSTSCTMILQGFCSGEGVRRYMRVRRCCLYSNSREKFGYDGFTQSSLTLLRTA